MKLRAHRRNLAVWSQAGGYADRKRRSELELAAYSTSALLGSWTDSAFSAPDRDLRLGTGRS